jgi:hypothetical protein
MVMLAICELAVNTKTIKRTVTSTFSQFRKSADFSLGEDSGYDDLLAHQISEHPDVITYLQIMAAAFPNLSEEQLVSRFSHRVYQRLVNNACKWRYDLISYFNLTDTKLKFAAGERVRDIKLAIQQELRSTVEFNQIFQKIITPVNVTADAKPRQFERFRIILEFLFQVTRSIVSVAKSTTPHDTPIHDTVQDTFRATTTDATPPTNGFVIAALILSALNAIFIPGYYLTCYLRGVPVPFNIHNNLKWAFSTISLGVSILGLLVPPATPIILSIYAGFITCYSLYYLGKYIYDRVQLSRSIQDNKLTIKNLKVKLQDDVVKAKNLHQQYETLSKRENVDIKILDAFKDKMITIEESTDKNRKQLKKARNAELILKGEIYKSKSIVRPAINITYLLLAGAFIAGVVLIFNPFTAPIGGILLGVGAILNIAVYVANKGHQTWERKQVNKILSSPNDNDDIELSDWKIKSTLRENLQQQIARQQEPPVLPSPCAKPAAPAAKQQTRFFATPQSPRHLIRPQVQSISLPRMRA